MNKDSELWYGEISPSTDWGGDSSTDNKPVSGQVVQKFIKDQLSKRVGVLELDSSSMMYLGFADEESKDKYLSDPKENEGLLLCSFPAASDYVVKILLESNQYNAIPLGQLGNTLKFSCKVLNEGGVEYIDNINYTIKITRNANSSEIKGVVTSGRTITVDLDPYLQQEGVTSIVIQAVGQGTMAKGSSAITYDVVNLELVSDLDISKVYDLNAEVVPELVIQYSIVGSSNTKHIEWYIDGEFYADDEVIGGTLDPLVGNKFIPISTLSHGVHNLQLRAYVIVNGDKFYTDVYYREFIVVSNPSDTTPLIAVEGKVPKDKGILNSFEIFDAIQYIPTGLTYAIYNPKNLEYLPIDIKVNDELVQVVNASNGVELSYSYIPTKAGNIVIQLVAETTIKSIPVSVGATSLNLTEITDNLVLSLSAVGRSNSDSNRSTWSYGNYSAVLSGFNWSEYSGWVDNRLVIGDGMLVEIDYAPLANTGSGKTIELEYDTTNVISDDAIICDMRDSRGVGLLITASEIRLRVGTAEDQVLSKKFKSQDNIRIGFVLDYTSKLAFIYVNGHVAGSIKLTSILGVDKLLRFEGSTDATLRLKQILVYDTKLNSDQMLNNWILYRDTVQEMLTEYEKNDILDGTRLSVDKLADYIPVMLLTGDINWLESQKDTDAQTGVDVEFIHRGSPEYSFTMYGACLRIQGTSSAGYPKKNYRLYTKRKTYSAQVYDWKGNLVDSQKLSFKPGAVPVNCWCLKADYAESSGSHNTGVARLWNQVMYDSQDSTEGYVLRTVAQKSALENGYEYDVRTTVDGYPIVVFARQSADEDYVFIGKYNFNNDKSTENVFGFCDIPGFDDKYVPLHEGEDIPEGEMNEGKPYTYGNKMQCWELLENGNKYALFSTVDNWFDHSVDLNGNPVYDEDDLPVFNWASGFEARYPDDGNEADTRDLYCFASWLVKCDSNPISTEEGYNEEFDFIKSWKDHIDPWKMAAYYVYLLRFGAVDQVVKNSMLTSEDGSHWYFINYDNDTILGLRNTGALVWGPNITRSTTDDSGAYVYAGHSSLLWNQLEACDEFMRYVSRVDSILYAAGLTYEQVLKIFNTEQSDQWCQRVYNKDAEYKYISPYINNGTDNLFMLQGSRKTHRTWWLSKRFKLMDGKFNNSNYVNQYIQIKINQLGLSASGMQIDITAGDYMYYGCQSNSIDVAMGVELNAGDKYSFKDPKQYNEGDVIYLFAPYALEELDLSHISAYLLYFDMSRLDDRVLGNRLKRLIISNIDENGYIIPTRKVGSFFGLDKATNLEYLDLRGLQVGTLDFSNLYLLDTLLLEGSAVNSVKLADGCAISNLQLSRTTEELSLHNLSNLSIESIENFEVQHISTLDIQNCPLISSDSRYFFKWSANAVEGDELTLTGINWTNVSPQLIIEFGSAKDRGVTLNLKGKVVIGDPTIDQVNELTRLFGSDCFTNNAQFWISAPESVFIHGKSEILSGTSSNYTTTIFSTDPGTLEWDIYSGSEWVKSIIKNSDDSCTLTTIEDDTRDHEIVIRAIHTPKNDDSTYIRWTTFTVTSKKVIYSDGGLISGDATINSVGNDYEFNLQLHPDTIWRGGYRTEWSIEGDTNDVNSIILVSQSNDSCKVRYINNVTFEYRRLIATVSNINSEGEVVNVFKVELPVAVTDENVLLTSTSNPEVMKVIWDYSEQQRSIGGTPWASNENVFYKSEAQLVGDIGTVFKGTNIKSFTELSEFKNIKSIPAQAFQSCSLLGEIELPINIQSIGSLAFNQTSIKKLNIPANVVRISYNAFNNAPIEEFIVDGGSSFMSVSGVLITQDGILIKYPEGRSGSEYITPELVTGLGSYAFSNTYLEKLILSDEVISHQDNAIRDNTYLKEISIGSRYEFNNAALSIRYNTALHSISVNSDNPQLASYSGVLYDKRYTTLVLYPSGRSEFSDLKPVSVIGSYSCSTGYVSSGFMSIEIPDSVELIEDYAFNENYRLLSITSSEISKLSTIGKYAFQLCNNLRSIELPPSLRSIESLAFNRTSKLGVIYCYAINPPSLGSGSGIIDVFGTSKDTYTGNTVDESNRILYVPGSSESDYESSDWMTSLCSEDKNKFKLIPSL